VKPTECKHSYCYCRVITHLTFNQQNRRVLFVRGQGTDYVQTEFRDVEQESRGTSRRDRKEAQECQVVQDRSGCDVNSSSSHNEHHEFQSAGTKHSVKV
jgi:hypothetical protein